MPNEQLRFALSRRWGASVVLAVGLGMAGPSQAAQAGDIRGVWMTEDAESAIEILTCGGARCGRVLWLKDPQDDNGHPLMDEHNPDQNFRSQPVCGLQIISGLKSQPDGSWDQGRIYDPETGRSYDVQIRPTGTDTLKVTGYLTVKALGETLSWSRVTKALKRCDEH